jgi:hypothetical protein
MHLVIEYYNYSRWYRLHSYPCDTLALMWQDPCRVDRAVRAKLTAEPETDCARDCNLVKPKLLFPDISTVSVCNGSTCIENVTQDLALLTPVC